LAVPSYFEVTSLTLIWCYSLSTSVAMLLLLLLIYLSRIAEMIIK